MSKNASIESRKRVQSKGLPRQRRSCPFVFIQDQVNRLIYTIQKKQEAELARQREADKAARSYDLLNQVEEDESVPRKYGRELEEDFM